MNVVEETLERAKQLQVSIAKAARTVGVDRSNIYRALKNNRVEPAKMLPAELMLLRAIQRSCKEREELIKGEGL